MIEPKVSLTLIVPGAVMVSREEALKHPKESCNEEKVLIKFKKGNGRYAKEVKKLITVRTRKCIPAKQHINISREAYDYMLETPTIENMMTIKGIKIWRSWPISKRLKLHFDDIASNFNAIEYSYEILDD